MPRAPRTGSHPGQDDVRGQARRDVLRAAVAEAQGVDPAEEVLAGAKYDGAMARCSSSINPALRYCRIVATPPPSLTSFAPAASVARPRAACDAVRDEVKRRAAVHRDRWSCAGVSTKTGTWYGGFASRPALPVLVEPWPADWTEHVATEDPRADVRHAAGREVVVDACRAAFAPVRRRKRPRAREPPVQVGGADAQRILEILPGRHRIR